MEILKSFQNRLQDISKRNRTLFLRRIVSKKTIDITNLSEISPSLIQKIQNQFIEKNQKVSISTQISAKKSQETVLKQMLLLKRDIDNNYFEKGLKECYIGYPFVEGHFHDKTEFRCPLLLYPVLIQQNRATKQIELIPNGKPVANETFLLAFNKFSKNQTTITQDQLKYLKEVDQENLYEDTLKLLKTLNITITYPPKDDFITFTPYQEKKHVEQAESRIVIKPYCVMGQFSQIQNALSNDYDQILAHSLKNDLFDILFGNKIQPSIPKKMKKESELYTISLLDSSQEDIVHEAKQTKGLVIHGPPGTGKSQVITNIIADKLKSKQKILFICDKRAALDVVFNRLTAKGLDKHTLLIHDSRNDRNDIFAKIASDFETYQTTKTINTSQLDEIHTKIETQLQDLTQKQKLFHQKNRFDKTLYELYSTTKSHSDTIPIPVFIAKKYTIKKVEELIQTFQNSIQIAYILEDKNHPFYYKKKTFASLHKAQFIQTVEKLKTLYEKLEQTIYTKEYSSDFTYLKKKHIKHLYKIGNRLTHFNAYKDSFFRFVNPRWFYIHSIYKKLIRENNLEELTKRWSKVQSILTEFKKNYAHIKPYLSTKYNTEIQQNLLVQKPLKPLLETIITELKNLNQYILFDKTFQKELNKNQRHIFRQCIQTIPLTDKVEDDWSRVIHNSFAQSWILYLEKKQPEIRNFTYQTYTAMQKEVMNLLEEKITLVPSAITNEYVSLFQTFSQNIQGATNNFNYIQREVTKKRNRLTLRQLFEQYGTDGLFEIYPCIMCSPQTASELFELKQIFDTVIFDEASQIRLEQAIPSILRSNQIIVAGDEKQLPPTSFFSSHSDEEEEYNYSDEEQRLLEDESLLIRAKTIFESKRLSYHYRSQWSELIEFSNSAFYNKNLIVVQPPLIPQKPIEYVKVSGIWYNQQNKKEAQAIISILQKEFAKKTNLTYGIITFNQKQRDLIEEMLLDELKKDTVFAKQLEEQMHKVIDSEFVGLFVKNIENVQGDERDVILFSTGYGFDSNRVFRYNFGPLNGLYGPNRLNVAISRAKQKIFVCASIQPSDFQYKGSMEGPKLLQQYLAYAHAISQKTDSKKALEKLSQKQTQKIYTLFEKRVAKDLQSENMQIVQNLGNEAFSINVAIKKGQSYCLGLLTQPNSFEESKTFDITKPYILSQKGWNMQTIYPNHWFYDSSKIIQRVQKK